MLPCFCKSVDWKTNSMITLASRANTCAFAYLITLCFDIILLLVIVFLALNVLALMFGIWWFRPNGQQRIANPTQFECWVFFVSGQLFGFVCFIQYPFAYLASLPSRQLGFPPKKREPIRRLSPDRIRTCISALDCLFRPRDVLSVLLQGLNRKISP